MPDSPVDPFRTIYDREVRYVWQGLRRLGVPTRDLPDVTHDVFFTVFRSLERYDLSRPFRPWLFGFMFRVASDHINLARNQRELLLEPPEPVDARLAPEDACASREEWQVVDRALRRLPVTLRAVLVMHDFQGHKGHEVAGALNLPTKTAFSRLRVARARFMELAADELSNRGRAKDSAPRGTKP